MPSQTSLLSRRTLFPALLALLSLGVASSHAQQIYQPAADAKAMVIDGQARFTVLTPRLIRMEWSADGKL